MPLRDYVCGGCGHRFEALEGMTADGLPPAVCPSCGAPEPARLFSATADRVMTAFMSPGEAFVHMRQKQEIERAAREGRLGTIRGKAPCGEFEPRIPKRCY